MSDFDNLDSAWYAFNPGKEGWKRAGNYFTAAELRQIDQAEDLAISQPAEPVLSKGSVPHNHILLLLSLLAEQVRQRPGGAYVQLFRNPRQRHGGLLPQSPRQRQLLRVPFAAGRQMVVRPAQALELRRQ